MEKTEIEMFAASFLPAAWLPWVRVALEAMAALSLVLAALRPVLALIPAGPARSWIDALDRVLHWAAGNTKALGDRVTPKRKSTSIPPLAIFALAVPLLGCAGSAEQQTRSALDAVVALVEPAQALASDQCAREKRALVDAMKPAEFERAAARCAKVDDGFLMIADVAEAALNALDSGQLRQAQDMYQQIAQLWRELRSER